MEQRVSKILSVFDIGCEVRERENDRAGRSAVGLYWNRQLAHNPWLRTKFPKGRVGAAKETPLTDVEGAVFLYLCLPGSLPVAERERRARKLCVECKYDYDEIANRFKPRMANNTGPVIEEIDDEETGDDSALVATTTSDSSNSALAAATPTTVAATPDTERGVVESTSGNLQACLSHLPSVWFANFQEYLSAAKALIDCQLNAELKLYDAKRGVVEAEKGASEAATKAAETRIRAAELESKMYEPPADRIAASERELASYDRGIAYYEKSLEADNVKMGVQPELRKTADEREAAVRKTLETKKEVELEKQNTLKYQLMYEDRVGKKYNMLREVYPVPDFLKSDQPPGQVGSSWYYLRNTRCAPDLEEYLKCHFAAALMIYLIPDRTGCIVFYPDRLCDEHFSLEHMFTHRNVDDVRKLIDEVVETESDTQWVRDREHLLRNRSNPLNACTIGRLTVAESIGDMASSLNRCSFTDLTTVKTAVARIKRNYDHMYLPREATVPLQLTSNDLPTMPTRVINGIPTELPRMPGSWLPVTGDSSGPVSKKRKTK